MTLLILLAPFDLRLRPKMNGVPQSSRTSGSTSSSLLNRVKSREPDAWTRLTTLYGQVVYHWARQSGLQPSDASDAVQEVFVVVARSISRFRRDRPNDSFRGWLWTIARNKFRDHYRRLGAQPEATGGSEAHQRMQQLPEYPPGQQADSDDGAEGSLHRRALELVREQFDERDWQIFWRVAVEGDSAADVAEDLGISVWTVYRARTKVLQRLHQEFAELID